SRCAPGRGRGRALSSREPLLRPARPRRQPTLLPARCRQTGGALGRGVRALEGAPVTPGRGLIVAGAVFVSGAVVLGMEIAASRVLAPFFGNSLFVWGALIGVVLAGLAVGYWAGGWLADRWPTPDLLVGVMALGALFVLAIPVLDGRVLETIVELDAGPRLNPLLAAIALFGGPSVILAGVAPIAVRLLAHSLTTLGQTAGRLFAISTAGSIAGTFATAFWLIPEFGTDQLLTLAAATLFAAAALVALSERLLVVTAVAAAGLALAGFAAVQVAPDTGGTVSEAQARNWSPIYRRVGYARGQEPPSSSGLLLRYAKDPRYHRLTVSDDAVTRYLRFDSSYQSGMVLGRPFATAFEYTDLFHLLKAYNPKARNVLFIGLGGGSAPKRLWRDFPELQLQGVELAPVVKDVAYRFFALPHDPRLQVAIDDGRRYLDRHDERWDAILIDAFFSAAIPFHLFTSEFLELARWRPLAVFSFAVPPLPLGLPDGARASDDPRGRRRRHDGSQPHPRRDRGCRALEGVPRGALGADQSAAPDGS